LFGVIGSLPRQSAAGQHWGWFIWLGRWGRRAARMMRELAKQGSAALMEGAQGAMACVSADGLIAWIDAQAVVLSG
jgi:hypothetical protein